MESRTHDAATRAELERFAELPLTQELNGILHFLTERGGMTVTQLAASIGVSVASASRYCASLESWGLVHKTRSDGDGRAVEVALTTQGERTRQRTIERWASVIGSALESLGTDRTRVLATALPRLQAGLIGALPISLPPRSEQQLRHDAPAVVAEAVSWLGVMTRQPPYSAFLLGAVGAADLSATQLLVLRTLGDHPLLGAGDIARRTGMDRSAASRLITTLGDQLLVSRTTRGSAPTAAVLASLSHAGRALLLSIEARELAAVEQAMEGWTRSEVETSLSAVDALATVLTP